MALGDAKARPNMATAVKPDSSYESESSYFSGWFDWDTWIIAAYRSRINFSSFCDDKKQELTDEVKEEILRKYRLQILNAIKHNKEGEHYNRQAFLYLFARLCVFLIAVSSGFVISNIFGAHMNTYAAGWGLMGTGAQVLKYSLAPVTFGGVFVSVMLTFRAIVPTVIRRFFEWGGKLKWHFFSPFEMKIFRDSKSKSIKVGYEHKDKPGDPRAGPPQSTVFGPKEYFILTLQFGLSAVVGLGILAQTIVKSEGGMRELFSFVALGSLPHYLAISMGLAAFFVMLAQYTFTTMELLRDPKKFSDAWRPLFKYSNEDGSNRTEVYIHNILMILISATLLTFVVIGMFNTSKVQGKNLLDMIGIQKNFVSKLTVTLLACGGKLMFTFKALGNLVGLLWARVGSWFSDKAATVKRNSEDEVTWWGYLSIAIFAIAKSFTSVDPPHSLEEAGEIQPELGEDGEPIHDPEFISEPSEPVEPPEMVEVPDHDKAVSKLYSPYMSQKFVAWAGVGGAFLRCAQEPLSNLRPNQELLPTPPQSAPAKEKANDIESQGSTSTGDVNASTDSLSSGYSRNSGLNLLNV